ncbi:methyl-accepting chemotaxis protein [Curvibacter lanceolatus]|uniref:methyl-accepting chemotaxis protein n=1 Tax=Curvibacter lanceolatus TaxID=86182 RepID=UPI0003609FE8|nr:methyl-accepting chemotaxis protein [Curvibacter lanceolatus]
MKIHSIPLRQQFLLLFFLLLTTVIGSSLMLWRLDKAELAVSNAHRNRDMSYRLADELRQSSDDLTRLARTYVVTGDPRWEKQYNEVIEIRAGKTPRPNNYQGIYWDFLAADVPVPGRGGAGESVALLDLMKRAGFSEAEFTKLQEAANSSNDLIRTEIIAMNLVKGLRDDGKGNFSIQGNPDLEKARELMHGPEYHRFKAKIMGPINDFFGLLEQRTAGAILAAEGVATQWQIIFEVFTAGMLLIFFLVLRSIFNHTISSVKQAAAFANQVAQGDLTAKIPRAANNEVGQLLNSLGDMNHSLSRLVGTVRTGGEAIHVASNEVATGNQDMSERTERTAASLEETSASMQQLTGAVNQNAAAAKEASKLAHGAVTVAIRGGGVVDEAVSTMGNITAASHRISDIIGTIDGIAFQTNILALNAAVEAARAGEQGRGFAVVASEVRMLAQRSAEAAKEIKTLIHDSVEKIDTGSTQVQAAGQTMKEIVTHVQHVSSLIGEISVASEAQSHEIRQIDEAIRELEQVTQQNAALVEEMTATSESLRQQADGLQDTVSVFKIEELPLWGADGEQRPGQHSDRSTQPRLSPPSPAPSGH